MVGCGSPAATGDADCACSDAAWQNRPASLGAENGALSLPLPWIAIEAGWFMTEFGRQPWAIQTSYRHTPRTPP